MAKSWRKRGRWSVAAVVFVAATAVAPLLMAGDFATDSREWNGFADFVDTAGQQGVALNETDTLEWRQVSSDDVIAVVYPTDAIDVTSLADFVTQGGRVLLADDFGASRSFIDRLAVERREPAPENLPHRNFIDDDPGWPLFTIEGVHPLLDGVEEVVANHSAVLHNIGGPVIAYDEQGGLVYDMMLGDGRAIVVADPGIFINAMLPVADNQTFAENLWTYLCDGVEECRAWLLIGDFSTRGAFDDEGDSADNESQVGEWIDRLNEKMREAFAELPGTQFLYFLSLFLVLGTVAYLMAVFPWRRARWLSQYIDRHRRSLSPPLTEFDWNIERFTEPDGKINYALPMAILKESFEDLFLDAFDYSRSRRDDRLPAAEIARRFDERYLRGETPVIRKRRREQVEQLLLDLADVPGRHRVFLESDETFSARDMTRLRRRILRVLGWMDLKETYERRSRKIDARHLRSRR